MACAGLSSCCARTLDLNSLRACAYTTACGESCTEDGMHFHNATYDVLLHQWANALRFHRRTTLCTTPLRASVNDSLISQLCTSV